MTAPATSATFAARITERFATQAETERLASEGRRSKVHETLRTTFASERAAGLSGGVSLFGSYAWGSPTESSDIDLLVDDEIDPDALCEAIERHIKLPIHVVRRCRADAGLIARVMRDGVAL